MTHHSQTCRSRMGHRPITQGKRVLRALLIAATMPSLMGLTRPAMAQAPVRFQALDAADFAPDVVLPPPPVAGSIEEKADLMAVHRLVESASPDRKAQAKEDAAHEDPSVFDGAAGIRLEDLPATWALLRLVQNEGEVAADLSKTRFSRLRPFAVDPTLPNCDGTAVPGRSYPSGHSTIGYSVGLMLAELMPHKASAILGLARDYALSRVICGVHYPADIDASHTLGTMVTVRLLLDPAVAGRIAAARAELARAQTVPPALARPKSASAQ